ncbi:MAG: FeoA family protein [Bacillota bacterium]|nr:FeoA family protein [Bacillota bacterium]
MQTERAFLFLSELPVGGSGDVVALEAPGPARQRLLDLGLVPGTRVEVLRRSPGGDPVAFRIRGAVIALRREASRAVLIRLAEA